MNQEDIIRMAREAEGVAFGYKPSEEFVRFAERFAALVAAAERQACVDIVEAYRIPVGNSSAGELACEWTYAALKEIRDDIKARGNT